MFDSLEVRILSFAAVTLGVMVLGHVLAANKSRDSKLTSRRLRELGSSPELPSFDIPETTNWGDSTLTKLGNRLSSKNGNQNADLSTRLALAGWGHPNAVQYYQGLQLVLVLSLAVLGVTFAALNNAPWSRIALWGVIGAGGGCMIPPMVLSNRVKSRQLQIRNALPDALDMMVLCIEGGASLPAAISWVAEEIPSVHPMFGEEMMIVHREMQLGLSAGEAFQSFADRCGIHEARDLAGALVQSERYGSSIAKALRSHNETARRERQLWAEEMAQKASVKIMFPMLLCIFPAMFVVLLGPAAFQLSGLFSK